MGGLAILVIGDDPDDQLEKFECSEYADPENRHWQTWDDLVSARKGYDERSANDVGEDVGFLEWAMKTYNYRVLYEQQAPDLDKLNRWGWIRLNGDGQVTELIHRRMPNDLFFYVRGGIDAFPLKKDRSAAIAKAREEARWDWDFKKRFGLIKPWQRDIDAREADEYTYTSSAAKGDIDFELILSPFRAAAEALWDSVASAYGSQTWEPFDLIMQRHKKEYYDPSSRSAAYTEWREQTAVKAIVELKTTMSEVYRARISSGSRCMQTRAAYSIYKETTDYSIDPLRLPKDVYTKRFGLRRILGYTDLIINGEHFKQFDEDQLFESMSEDTLITMVGVKA